MIKSSKLSISIHDVEFAKDFQYFIEVHYEGIKKQTDLSALARNPIFTNNTFFFDPPSSHTIRGAVIFVANVGLQSSEPLHSKNNAPLRTKMLGQCTLDLTPFGIQPTQAYNLPIRQQMQFIRVKDGKQISVGRFIVSFKIVPEEDVPTYITQIQEKKIERNEIFVDLPDYDELFDFHWRLKVDIRQALNILSIDNLSPQAYVQIGWTQYKDTLPEQKRLYSTIILNSNHPQWNQTFLITNPPHIDSCKGFLMISLKQKNSLEDIIRTYIPIQSLSLFVPYNIKLKEGKQTASPTYLFASIVLEATQSLSKESLHDLIVADIVFDQGMVPFKQMNLALVVDTDNEPKINFLQINSREDNIERVLQFDQAQQFTFYLTHTMRVPPIKSSKQFRAACIFTIPQSFLSKNISIYLVYKTGKGTYALSGIVQSIQKDLISLLIQKQKKRLFFGVRPHSNVKIGKCQIQIADKEESRVQQSSQGSRAQSRHNSKKGEETATQKLMHQLNISSNDSLMKHANQNNQIIVRILRQLDDKSQSLRQAASQICDLRSRVKLLQNQNSILRRKALKQQDQLVNLVQREVDNMNPRQLKEKIIKISQLYKSQRIKNKDLQKSIAAMQPQVSNTMQLNSIIANQKNELKIFQEKVQKFKKDNERINIYKQTIKKQEKVIIKLERVMKDGMQEVRGARATKIQLEELKKKGLSTGNSSYNSSHREQILRLQSIIAELQKNQKKGVNFSNVSDNSPNSYELEFKLHQAQTRIQSLEHELQQKSKSYAREMAMYKMKMAEKQAILDGFSHNQSYN